MKKILLILFVLSSIICNAQYAIDRIYYDNNGGVNDTLYSNNTDTLWRKNAEGEYMFAIKTNFKKFVSAAEITGGGQGGGDLLSTNNLSDLIDAATARINLGIGNVNNTSDANKPVSAATQTALDLKANLASPTFTGAVSGITKAMVGLGNVDNTTDAGKPVSTATQTVLDLKANLASPTFTGTVSGVTKAMVGLGNADNTTDAGKPVSTATQTALNAKAPLYTGGSGIGGTVTQATNKTTGVTLNKICGQITMNGAALAAAAEVSFVVTNNTVASTDVVIVNVQSVGTAGAYFITVGAVSNGSFAITVGNASTGSLSQAVILNFAVLKSVSN